MLRTGDGGAQCGWELPPEVQRITPSHTIVPPAQAHLEQGGGRALQFQTSPTLTNAIACQLPVAAAKQAGRRLRGSGVPGQKP